MIKSRLMLKITTINGELVIGIELRLESVGRVPWIGGRTFENIHAVMNCRAVKVTPLKARVQLAWLLCKDDQGTDGVLKAI
jgi:hypothetical protein